MGVYNYREKQKGVRITDCKCCKMRKRVRNEEEYKKLINRLNRIEGQVRGIRNMLENDAYCVDILTQASAVNAAVNAFEREILAQHIRTCVAEDLKCGKEEKTDELIDIISKMVR